MTGTPTLPNPIAKSRPVRLIKPRCVCACVCLVLVASSAMAQETFDLTKDGGWSKQPTASPDSPEGKLQAAHKALAKKDAGTAIDLASAWIEAYPRHPSLPDAYVLRGDAKVMRGEYYDALYDFEYVARAFAGTDAFNKALQREYEIAVMYLAGVKRKLLKLPYFFGLKILPASGEGEELLIRIQERAPGSELGERASLTLADYYFKTAEMSNALIAYDMFMINYPRSVHREHALLMLIRTHLATFKGPQFDATGLQESLQRIRQYRREFPVQAEKLGLEGIEIRIRESMALKALSTAQWYADTGKYVSARYMYRRVVRDHPDSAAARSALIWLKARGVNPALPKSGDDGEAPEQQGPLPPTQEPQGNQSDKQQGPPAGKTGGDR